MFLVQTQNKIVDGPVKRKALTFKTDGNSCFVCLNHVPDQWQNDYFDNLSFSITVSIPGGNLMLSLVFLVVYHSSVLVYWTYILHTSSGCFFILPSPTPNFS